MDLYGKHLGLFGINRDIHEVNKVNVENIYRAWVLRALIRYERTRLCIYCVLLVCMIYNGYSWSILGLTVAYIGSSYT